MTDGVVYREILPCLPLQNFIYCYFQLKTTRPLNESYLCRIVANGCVDIYFNLDNTTKSYVVGFCEKNVNHTLDKIFNIAGVRFLPAMFPQIFKINAAELSNRSEELAGVLPKTARFIADNFSPDLNADEIKVLFDLYFTKIIADANFAADNRLYKSLELILKSRGGLRTETDLGVGISSRQLRRLFEFYIGDTPKMFSKVVRFQNVLQSILANPGEKKVFYDYGYYDQAHFIKDFKNFYGLTPAQVFR